MVACAAILALLATRSYAQSFFDDFETGVLSDQYVWINGDGLIPADVEDQAWADTAWIVTTSSTFDGYAALSISWYEDANGNEVGPADDWLILPKLLIGPGAQLTFDVKSATSSGNFPDDYWVLINGGDPTIESFESDGEILLQITDEQSGTFRTETIDLANYTGQEMHIAFRNVTNTNGYGLWLDNISVSGASSVQTAPTDFFSMKISPNPVSAYARLQYSLPKASDVEISVQDVFGRTLATVRKGAQAANRYEVGLPIEGLGNGTYLVSLRTGEQVATTRLLIAR